MESQLHRLQPRSGGLEVIEDFDLDIHRVGRERNGNLTLRLQTIRKCPNSARRFPRVERTRHDVGFVLVLQPEGTPDVVERLPVVVVVGCGCSEEIEHVQSVRPFGQMTCGDRPNHLHRHRRHDRRLQVPTLKGAGMPRQVCLLDSRVEEGVSTVDEIDPLVDVLLGVLPEQARRHDDVDQPVTNPALNIQAQPFATADGAWNSRREPDRPTSLVADAVQRGACFRDEPAHQRRAAILFALLEIAGVTHEIEQETVDVVALTRLYRQVPSQCPHLLVREVLEEAQHVRQRFRPPSGAVVTE